MLRIIQNQQVAGAKNYYSTADYYTEGQELAGEWRGRGAKMLGLTGKIEKADWDAMCEHTNPRTGDSLFQRRKDNRTVGYDLNFHVPKSVSLLYALSKDERLLDAFRDSVDETMNDIEAEMQTRVRKGGRNEERTTGNMVWGEYVHLTSRPVDGVPDPHLHSHCFALNVTWDDKERLWKAGQFRDIKRDAPYFEALFHARLAHKLSDLGLPIERNKNGWEIGVVSRTTLAKFSRRTAEIEEVAREKGITDAAEKAELGAKTRSRKAKHLTFSELQAEWRSRLSANESDGLASIERRIGGASLPMEANAAAKSVDHAIAHEFERRSVVPERTLLATALRHAAGNAAPQDVHHAMQAKGLLTAIRNGQRVVTTREVLAEEQRIVRFARSGRGTCRPLGDSRRPLADTRLNKSQQAAVQHILDSRDRVTVVQGRAGVGKTTLLREAVAAIEANGTRVFAFAPSADASRGVLRSEGFKDADTVARLLVDPSLQRQAKGQLLLIDEAGLLGAKTTANLFALAERIDARILLVGDSRQHASPSRGAMLRLLEEEAGVKPAVVREIQRQSGEYKAAIRALADGRTSEGFTRLDRLGWIKESPTEDRYRQLAADYVETVTRGKTALVISPSHREKDRVNAEIRRLLKERGLIGKDERAFVQLTNAQLTEAERGDAANYRSGDVLQFHQNAKGHRRGQRVVVEDGPLPVEQAKRYSVFRRSTIDLAPGDTVRITNNGFTMDGRRLNNGATYKVKGFDDAGNIVLGNGWTIGKEFGHVAYGAVVTSHAAQSRTVARVIIGQSAESYAASSQEQFYVSCSRGRKSAIVYCDSKTALRNAVARTDDRATATELLNQHRRREMVAQYDRDRELRIREAAKVREAAYVRR
jgi:conjugative relaxase-like TrwC/TraI family protein